MTTKKHTKHQFEQSNFNTTQNKEDTDNSDEGKVGKKREMGKGRKEIRYKSKQMSSETLSTQS